MPVPAAQYLRMSTEHQQYSLVNQAAKISEYAADAGFQIIKTYEDSGRSGLVFRRRPGLLALLSDVVSNARRFRAVLVYDVSRWGRFQDIDEAAHYEFLCTRAGVPVHYCAEQFINDGSIPSSILKSLKRTMAAEYSRELGTKVYAGQARLVRNGFWMGASPGYGLRRMMLSSEGEQKGKLRIGDHKSFSMDRIVLVPGPEEEVRVVQDIFDWASTGTSAKRIAEHLNQIGIRTTGGRNWSYQTVLHMLRNPKYTGTNAWGRTTQRLGGSTVRVPNEQWIQRPESFAQLVSCDKFQRVQLMIGQRKVYSDEAMLEGLKRVFAKYGRVSHKYIRKTKGVPCDSQICERFGSLERAYELIGYVQRLGDHSFYEQRLRSKLLRDDVVERIVLASKGRAVMFQKSGTGRPQVVVDGQIKLDVLICPRTDNVGKLRTWFYYPHHRNRRADFTVACALSHDNNKIARIYLLLASTRRQRFSEEKFEQQGLRIRKPSECPVFCYADKWFSYMPGVA
jgi:DNA invertase Pin-like site-specific DNA recombinase